MEDNFSKFKKGDMVKLIPNIKVGYKYNGLHFYEVMLFEGYKEILGLLNDEYPYYRIGTEPNDWFWYSDEMLTT